MVGTRYASLDPRVFPVKISRIPPSFLWRCSDVRFILTKDKNVRDEKFKLKFYFLNSTQEEILTYDFIYLFSLLTSNTLTQEKKCLEFRGETSSVYLKRNVVCSNAVGHLNKQRRIILLRPARFYGSVRGRSRNEEGHWSKTDIRGVINRRFVAGLSPLARTSSFYFDTYIRMLTCI